jgi:hypothetical protein
VSITDLILYIAVLAFSAYALITMMLAVRRDSDWQAQLEAFVSRHGYRARPAPAPATDSIDLSTLRRSFGRDPTLLDPAADSEIHLGQIDHHRVRLDEVWYKPGLFSSSRLHLRFHVPLPDAPRDLQVRPAGRLWRWWQRLAPDRGDRFRQAHSLSFRLARSASMQARQRHYLSRKRLLAMQRYAARHGGVHIRDGQLWLVHRRDRRGFSLETLYTDVQALVRLLGERG